MVDRSRTAITYRYECWRALSAGVIEAASPIFLFLIAVRYYHAGPLAKALVAGGGSAGLILAPRVVSRVEASGWPVAKAAARLAALGACCFLLMALLPVLPVYVAGSVLAMTASAAAIPLMTQIYQENYPERVAGYMSVHTCFTGARGVLAPVVAFYLVSGLPPNVLGWISVGLIAIGSAFLVPEIKSGKTARPSAAVVGEISE